MKLKKNLLLTLSLLSLIISPALASNWTALKNEDKTIYVDTQSLMLNFNEQKALYWIKFKNNNNNYKLMIISDCASNQNAIKRSLRYSSTDTLLEEKNYASPVFKSIIPDSNAEVAHRFVCNIYNEEEYKDREFRTNQEAAANLRK